MRVWQYSNICIIIYKFSAYRTKKKHAHTLQQFVLLHIDEID